MYLSNNFFNNIWIPIFNRIYVKLPNDIKQAITKELLDELHEDLIHFCINCNADITAKEMFCSSDCIGQDLQRRWQTSNVYKIEQESK